MTRRTFLILGILCILWIFSTFSLLFGQTEFHGADSVFQKNGITILWAILKGPDEDRSWVYLQIVASEKAVQSFQRFSVEAVDPFTNTREWVSKGNRLERETLIKETRSSFRDKTGRRVLFYWDAAEVEAGRPAMTVFYVGVPDTTPELLTEQEIRDYFQKALQRLKND
jgi:hypothetical protein